MKLSDKSTIKIKLTQGQAEKLGIVFCKCGHPPNNHFDGGDNPCAHCRCHEYRQVISLPSKT
jgi:hypothetical protein